MTGTPFDRFVALRDALDGTASRNRKVELVAGFLTELAPDERAPGARFVAGQTLSPLDDRSLDVGYALVEDAGGGRQATLTPDTLTVGGSLRRSTSWRAWRAAGPRDAAGRSSTRCSVGSAASPPRLASSPPGPVNSPILQTLA